MSQFFFSVVARKFKVGGIMSRRGIDRVSVIFCSSSLVESRLCTHRTHVDHRIGLKIPFVAPAPCCTLGHAVLRRQRGCSGTAWSIGRPGRYTGPTSPMGGCSRSETGAVGSRCMESGRVHGQGLAGSRGGAACRTRPQLQSSLADQG